MRDVILNLAVSLDGFIAGPQGEYDWCLTDQDYGMTEFLSRIDSTLMGRKTYEITLQYGAPYPEYTNYVFTQTLSHTDYKNVVLVHTDLVDYVRMLKQQEGKSIWLYGGADIIHPLMEAGLVDEWMLAVHPIILGSGIPMFKKGSRHQLTWQKSIPYSSGLVQLIYRK